MRPTIRARRWWWPPDRKKAKLANIIMQEHINKEVQAKYDKLRKDLYGR